jgi:hypothetical protein
MKIKNTLISIFIVLLHTTVFAQEKTNLELKDLFDMEYISDPQISPDGSQVVFIRNFRA